MTRRISLSQLQSRAREAARKQKQAIDRYNQEVRRYNQRVKQAVDKYNREARVYNSRIRANQQRLKNELERLNRQPAQTRYIVLRTSVEKLNRAYVHLEQRAESSLDSKYNLLLDLSEQETANSVGVLNTLLGDETDLEGLADTLSDTLVTDELRAISEDLDDRWRGAVFALNPNNPDAARHFCTSAREIMDRMLEFNASDMEVIDLIPDCEKTDHGKPTRRAKIKFFLYCKDMKDDSLEEFVEKDIENVIDLFRVLNDGTHGSAGKFNLQQLSMMKKRVEDGIIFLSKIVN